MQLRTSLRLLHITAELGPRCRWYSRHSTTDVSGISISSMIKISSGTLTRVLLNCSETKSSLLSCAALIAKEYVEFLLLHVKPRTISSSASVEWFLDRMFSLTSSTVDAVVHVISKRILKDHPRRQDYEIVLRFASKSDLLPDDEGDDDESVEVNQAHRG